MGVCLVQGRWKSGGRIVEKILTTAFSAPCGAVASVVAAREAALASRALREVSAIRRPASRAPVWGREVGTGELFKIKDGWAILPQGGRAAGEIVPHWGAL